MDIQHHQSAVLPPPKLPKTPHVNTSPSSRMLEEVIKDKYELIDKIGSGSYGIIYRAINLHTDKHVALKVIHHSSEYGLRCLIEPIIMTSIKHKHLINASEILTHPNFTCIVMDLGSHDLYNYIKLHPSTLNLNQRIQWCWELTQGVASLHANDIIHGDLKSSNCLIMPDKSLKLIDYSMSVFMASKEQKNTHIISTFTHRASEVFMGNSWGKAADVWSLGCTLYEIIYGRVLFPYQGDQTGQKKEEAYTGKMLQCLKEWGKITNQNTEFIPSQKNIKYISVNSKFKDETLYQPINDLILQMLVLNPEERPTIFNCLAHPVFQYNYQVFPYKTIDFITSSSNEIMKYEALISQSCPKNLSDMVGKLVYYIVEEKGIYIEEKKEDLFIWTVIFIVAKITHQPMQLTPPFSWTDMIQMEQNIIHKIKWIIPFMDLKS